MSLSKAENKEFGEKCLPFVVRSVATHFGQDFRVHPRVMNASPTAGLHITGERRHDANHPYPLNAFVFWSPAQIRQFLDDADRPVARERASEQVPQDIIRHMQQCGIDFAGRSQAKGEVMMIALADTAS
jgi:hypothetical protein